MTGIVCSLPGVFTVAATAQVIRKKIGLQGSSAVISTSQSKFGGSSQYGGFLTANTSVLDYSTTDLTIEFWIRYPTISRTTIPVSTRSLNNTLSAGEWQFVQRSDNKSQFNFRNCNIDTTSTVSANTWYHFAIVRSGSTFKVYQNGTEVGSGTDSGTMNNSNIWFQNTGDNSFGTNSDAYIDEFRLSKTARYTSSFTPSTTPFVNDENTLLLLHMNGTNNSTFFEDDNGVRSQKGISAIGNAQIDTAQSKFGGASALFDGTGDYLKITDSSLVSLNTPSWTIEYWIRINSQSGSFTHIVGIWGTTGEAWYTTCNAYDTTRKIGFQYINTSGSNSGPLNFGSTLTTGTWQHHAFVNNNGTLTVYIDGTSVGTHTMNGQVRDYSTQSLTIGCKDDGGGAYNGWLDEIRISNTARYTSGFTPSTTPFVNDANTVLLIHADGTDASTFFEDDNGVRSKKGLYAIGNAQVDTAQSKFGGASMLFDGTGDYLIVGNAVDNDMALTGNYWTVEYWARINAHAGSYQATIAIWDDVGSTGSVYYFSTNMYNGTQKMGLAYYKANNTDSGALSFGSALATGTWKHHAFVRNGNTLTAYLDGVSQGTHDMTGVTIDITGYNSSSNTSLKMTIGAMTGGGGAYNGWLDEIRISNTARYTAGFTPSTTPFVNDANTVLLIHGDGTDASTGFRDDNGTGRSQVALIPNSSAQISTAQSKFGGSSALFARSAPNDWVKTSDSSVFSLENYSSWTIEFWLRFANNQSDNFPISTSDDKFNMRIQSGGSCNFNTQGSSPSWTKTHTVGTWYHYAVVKESGGTVRVYLDGTSVATGTVGGTTPSSRSFYIGDRFDTGYCMDGYIDEVRISNTARYSTTFTPSTTPFQNDSNTLLLMHMDGTNGSTTFIDDNGTTPT